MTSQRIVFISSLERKRSDLGEDDEKILLMEPYG